MIQPSKHLWAQLGNKPKDYIDECWHDLMPPLLDEFYYPFYHVNSSQIYDVHLFDKNNGTIFVKDGVLSLLHLFTRIIKSKDLIESHFAVPMHMAPAVPLELRKFFLFYGYSSPLLAPKLPKEKGLLFLPPLRHHLNLICFEKQLLLKKDQYDEILIVRPNLKEEALRTLTGSHYDLVFYNKCLAKIKTHFPKTQITTVASDQLFGINLLQYDYINTNHYNFFCSEDFFSYYYFFSRGELSISLPPAISADFSLVKTMPLVKDLPVHFYRYQGSSLFSDEEIQILYEQPGPERIFIDPKARTSDYFQFYGGELYELATGISNKLFNLLKGKDL